MIQKKEKFHCYNCGYCCMKIVLVSEDEIKAIEKLGHDRSEFVEEDATGRQRIRMRNYYCWFLTLDKGKTACKIYKKRPATCQKYPFFEGGTDECMASRLFDDGLI